jgi:hypothetical protein
LYLESWLIPFDASGRLLAKHSISVNASEPKWDDMFSKSLALTSLNPACWKRRTEIHGRA